MSNLYSNEENDFSEEKTTENEGFCSTVLQSFQFEPKHNKK